MSPISLLLAFPPEARTARVCISGKISPPPKPCRTRKPIRLEAFHASAHSTDPATNTSSAAIQVRLPPHRLSAQPVIGIATAIASRYPVVTHWIVPSVECSVTVSVCSARVTIVESRIAAIPPTISAKVAFRAWGVSPAVPCCLPNRCLAHAADPSSRYHSVS